MFERALGIQGFAEWASLGALLTVFVPLACMGSTHLLLSSDLAAEFVGRRCLWLLLIYFGSFTSLALAAFEIALKVGAPGNLMTLPSVLLLSVFLVQIPIVLVYPVYQRRGHMQWVAAWPLLQTAFRLLAAITALIIGLGVFGVMVTWVLLSLGLVAVAVRAIWPSVRTRILHSDKSGESSLPWRQSMSRLFASGIGFGLSDLLDSLDLKLVVPLAALLLSVTETAAAGLATVLLSAVQFFPYVLVMRVLLPAVHRDSDATSGELRALVLRLSAIVTLSLAPFAVAFWWVGFPILALVARGDYSSQEQAISWLGICFVPLCVSQFAAAPHMVRRSTWRLFWWRVEALGLFILVSLALSNLRLLAIVIGFTVGRTWLCARVLWTLRMKYRAT